MHTHIFEIRGRCILQYIFSICNLLSFGERERDKTRGKYFIYVCNIKGYLSVNIYNWLHWMFGILIKID